MGTGWVGWTARETLDTPLPLIVEAYRGVEERLVACYGGSQGTRALDEGAQERIRGWVDELPARRGSLKRG